MNLATILASVRAMGARLRAARLGKLPPQPQAPERPALPGLRPPLGPWQGSKDLADWFPWRFNHEGTTTGRISSKLGPPNESPLPRSDVLRCVRCGQEGHRSSQCPQKWFEGDFHSIELHVLATMTDAERLALLSSAPPGTHWEITEAGEFTEAMWRKLNASVHSYPVERWGSHMPKRCPWDNWKAERAFY